MKPHSFPSKQDPRAELIRSLEKTKLDLDLAQNGFSHSIDPYLISFYLFEIDALNARHSYLLRQLKSLDNPLPPH